MPARTGARPRRISTANGAAFEPDRVGQGSIAVNWDDLKYLLAAADAGALAAAARALSVDPSTVSRRISALERDLGAELLARTPEGLTLTDAGRSAVATARIVEAQLATLAAEIGGERAEPAGHVRVSSTHSFAKYVVRAVVPLRDRFPELTVEALPTSAQADLRRREADVAVRMFRDDHDGLAIRKLGAIGWALYAMPAYLKEHPRRPEAPWLEGHDVVGYSDGLGGMAGATWLSRHAPTDAIRIRCGTPGAALEAALAGIGVAALPCYLAHETPLVRVSDAIGHTDVYAVFLPERRGEARLRVVIDALADLFVRESGAFAA